MAKTKRLTPSKGVKSYREILEFDAPQNPIKTLRSYEPRHPLLDGITVIGTTKRSCGR